SALPSSGQNHHRDIGRLRHRRGIPFRDYVLDQQKNTVFRNRAPAIGENSARPLIIPIMYYLLHQVRAAARWHFLEEITTLYIAAKLQITAEKASLGSPLDHMRQVGQNST